MINPSEAHPSQAMFVDLHSHSTLSDGTESPQEVAARAMRAGLEYYSLTDHDCVDGYDSVASTIGDRAVPGVEITADFHGKTVHLLAYDRARDGRWTRLSGLLGEIRSARLQRAHAIVAKLQKLSVSVDVDGLFSKHPTIGRPHIAQAMVRAGGVATTEAAFSRYLHDGGPADVPVQAVSVLDATRRAVDAGAVISMAHPHTLGAQADKILREHRGDGLTGIEAYYGLYKAKERKRWKALALRFDLVKTGGSDFHGKKGHGLSKLGVRIPNEDALSLRRWLGVD